MRWFQVLAAVPVCSDEPEAVDVVVRLVRRRLSDAAEPTARLRRVELSELRWIETHWVVQAESDERAGIWVLRTLRAALDTVCQMLQTGRRHATVDVEPEFALCVEPFEESA
jgi:hypothetical protein